jgi:hypothetical protein
LPLTRVLTVLALALAFTPAPALAAEADWRHEIRPAMEEAEGRGVPLLIYLTRDD